MPIALPQRTRVLIVDDEPAVLDGLRREFRQAAPGWDISYVLNASEALMTAEMQVHDVIISDIRMPGMHGAELLTRFAVLHPTILRIAFSDKYDALTTNAVTDCPHHYIAKPCKAEALYSSVDTWLRRHRRTLGRSHDKFLG